MTDERVTGLAARRLGARTEDGESLSLLWWMAPPRLRAVSTSIVGGGLGECRWFLNAHVRADYGRLDPDAHLRALADSVGLRGPGVAMLTAVDVTSVEYSHDGGVEVLATVGLGWPTWAAAPSGQSQGTLDGAALGGAVLDGAPDDAALLDAGQSGAVPPVGTINLFVLLPAPLCDAALVNVLATVTEAKVQALHAEGVAGTGTASDAVCVAAVAPPPGQAGPDELVRFGGPRSHWGACAARAAYRAVRRGAFADRARATAAGWPRPSRRRR